MKNSVLTIIVLAVLFVGVIWWFQSAQVADVTLPAAPTETALRIIQQLQEIKIDQSFFQDQRFRRLESSPALSLEGLNTGRRNPFLPLGR